jgi:hypothetical protein
MLNLTIAPPGAQAPPVPNESDAGLTTWHDHDGAVCAYGHTAGDRRWVHVSGVGAFGFTARGTQVRAVPLASASRELVIDTFRRTVLPLAIQARGDEVLHASAVRTGAGVVAVCAVSGTGKSTLAYALSRRGHVLWADDAVCFDASVDPIRAMPLPFAIRLRPESVAHFGFNGNRTVERPLAAPLAATIVLERLEPGAAARLDRLSPTEAFPATLTHGYCFTIHDRERSGHMLDSYMELASRVPVFRLSFPAGLEQLDSMTDLIEDALPALAS